MNRQNRRHNILLALTILFYILTASSGFAQTREMTSYPRVKLQTLDKATARTMTFEARVGSTMKFGPLYIKVQSCQKSSPLDQPESSAFVQIWENVGEEQKPEWVFSGWMFASSPALSPMDHPIYDVWLIDCLDEEGKEPEVAAPAPVPQTQTPTAPVEEDPDAVPLD
jgi:hypothetical protein